MSNYEIVSVFSLESDFAIENVYPFIHFSVIKQKPLKQNRLRSIIPPIFSFIHRSSFSVIITLEHNPTLHFALSFCCCMDDSMT